MSAPVRNESGPTGSQVSQEEYTPSKLLKQDHVDQAAELRHNQYIERSGINHEREMDKLREQLQARTDKCTMYYEYLTEHMHKQDALMYTSLEYDYELKRHKLDLEHKRFYALLNVAKELKCVHAVKWDSLP
jgi:hypothetical protein